ncbi:helix-turn-helix domain-containing protein [Maribacter antarcticus]|uniref:helix-turn-helix domain-containing protein n=1 Tax=Maribacter antarcticus TaxID=505250 RepID=UPI0021CF7160|nr:helix-turn-helix domain-containing protein [Maribacter antarcticus]
MTRQETVNYFKVNMSTLHNWTKKDQLLAHGIGGRVYYKRSEIQARLIRIN